MATLAMLDRAKIFNALLFNIAWLLCVKGGDAIALITAIVVTVIHITWIGRKIKELILLVAITLLGFVVDSLLIGFDVLILADGSILPPLWLICLWFVFANTLNSCLVWFQTHLKTAALLGGLFGAGSYVLGAKWSDTALMQPESCAFILLFLLWALLFPLLLMIARYFRLSW